MRPLLAPRIALAAAVATVALAPSVAHGQAPRIEIRKGPYLQRLGADSVEVRIELSAPSTASIEVSPVDADAGAGAKRKIESASAPFHVLRVSGLSPRTRYRYVVHVGGGGSESGELVTAPANDDAHPFEFLVYGDNRSDPTAHATIVRAIARHEVDFLVHSGDFVVEGGATQQWQDFFEIEKPLLKNECLFACVGNHELFTDAAGANFTRYFGPSESDTSARLYGTFRWGTARFFLLNAFESWDGPEGAWLQAELAHADAEPGLRWRFVVIHASPWSGGPHGNNERMLAAGVNKLLLDHKVDLVLAGHDHIYERGVGPLGLKYVISGGGGAPLYRDVHVASTTRKIEPTYNFVTATVTPDAVKLVAERPDGSIIEKCGFGHAGTWDCDPTAVAAASASPQSVAPAPPPTAPPQPRASSCGCESVGAASGGCGAASVVAAVTILAARRRRRS